MLSHNSPSGERFLCWRVSTPVPWANYTHAYGPATDVPTLLRERASTDPEVAANAEYELFGNIWHQGTVYDATSFAIPFLIELLLSKSTHKREGLVGLLEVIAQGHGYYEIHCPLTHVQKALGKIAIASKLSEEEIYVPRARTAVESYFDTYCELLNESNLAVRRYIPCLLAVLPKGHVWLREHALSRASAEHDLLTAANLVFALSRVCKGQSEFAARAVSTRLPDAAIVHVAVAHVVLTAGDAALAEDAAQIALMPLLKPEEFEESYFRNNFFDNSDGVGQLLSLLPLVTESAKPALFKTVLEILPTLDDITASMLADPLIEMVFDPYRIPARAAELTEAQKTVLQQVTRTSNTVHLDSDFTKIMKTLQKSGVLKELGIASREHW